MTEKEILKMTKTYTNYLPSILIQIEANNIDEVLNNKGASEFLNRDLEYGKEGLEVLITSGAIKKSLLNRAIELFNLLSWDDQKLEAFRMLNTLFEGEEK